MEGGKEGRCPEVAVQNATCTVQTHLPLCVHPGVREFAILQAESMFLYNLPT